MFSKMGSYFGNIFKTLMKKLKRTQFVFFKNSRERWFNSS